MSSLRTEGGYLFRSAGIQRISNHAPPRSPRWNRQPTRSFPGEDFRRHLDVEFQINGSFFFPFDFPRFSRVPHSRSRNRRRRRSLADFPQSVLSMSSHGKTTVDSVVISVVVVIESCGCVWESCTLPCRTIRQSGAIPDRDYLMPSQSRHDPSCATGDSHMRFWESMNIL